MVTRGNEGKGIGAIWQDKLKSGRKERYRLKRELLGEDRSSRCVRRGRGKADKWAEVKRCGLGGEGQREDGEVRDM